MDKKKLRRTDFMFRWWMILESVKALSWILILSDPKKHMFYIPWIVAIITIIVFNKSFSIIRSLITMSLEEENESMRLLYSKTRNNLLLIFIFDLLPFIPLIQLILRCRYYKLDNLLRAKFHQSGHYLKLENLDLRESKQE